jgi:hypothetical protein
VKPPALTYCTNVHPLGDFAAWTRTLGFFGPAIRKRLEWPRLPMGLWFPNAVVEEMARDPDGAVDRIRKLLSDGKLGTFTLNAFPYGDFHDRVVKTKVYAPDWTDERRLRYTLACARILSGLLPQGEDGSISTLPLGWRVGWSRDHARRAAERLMDWVREALRLSDATGRSIRLGLEPEPGCALETTDQAISYWDAFLRPAAKAAGLTPADLDAHLGLCYDTCHQAVQFEDPVEVLDRLAAAGIPIAKMQLSSALEFLPDPARRSLALRREFVEERFLHQTRIRTPRGILSFDDLPEALDAAGAPPGARGLEEPRGHDGDDAEDVDLWAHPWRVHFHVPIDAPGLLDPARIATTRDDMIKAYRYARAKGLCRHFEVETYTWSVMPPAHRPDGDEALADCIAREIRFIETL